VHRAGRSQASRETAATEGTATRATIVLIAFASLAAAILIPVAADRAEGADASRPGVVPYAPGVDPIPPELRKELENYEPPERSPAEVRERSAAEYSDLPPEESAALMQNAFADYFSGVATSAPLDGEDVTRYVDQSTAIVDKGGEPALAASTLPLLVPDPKSGEPVPLDTSLRNEEGGFAPAAIGPEILFPGDPSRGISIGGSDHSITMNFASPESASEPIPLRKSDSVLYADVATDVDLVASPMSSGFRLALQIRSEASPERIRLPLDLPAEARLVANPDTHTAAVATDGKPDLLISPTVALDSDGRSIPVDVSAEGSDLILTVAHREEQPLYPLILDPTVTSCAFSSSGGPEPCLSTSDDFETDPTGRGWVRWKGREINGVPTEDTTSDSDPLRPVPYTRTYGQFFPNTATYGLFVGAPSATYLGKSYGLWYQSVPNLDVAPGSIGDGTAYFRAVTFDTAAFYVNSGSSAYPTMYLSLFNWRTENSYDVKLINSTSAYGSITVQAGSDDGANRVDFGVTNPNTQTLYSNQYRYGYIGGATTYIGDAEEPHASLPQGEQVDHDWHNDPGPNKHFEWVAEDEGLGIRSMRFQAGFTTGTAPIDQTHTTTCSGGDPSHACPRQEPHQFSYDSSSLSQGINGLFATPKDALDKTPAAGAEKLDEMRIDTTAPSVTVTGGLKDPSAAGHDLHFEATDGDPASAQTARSGVAHIKLSVDDPGGPDIVLVDEDQDNFTSAHPNMDSAPLEDGLEDYVLPAGEHVTNGERHFSLEIEDAAGNVSTTGWDDEVNFEPSLQLSGSLKDAAEGDHDVDGPTRLKIEATPAGTGLSVTDLKAEVSTDGGASYTDAWTFHKDCNASPPCSLDDEYFHFPERWGRGEVQVRVTAINEDGGHISHTISFDQDESRTGELRQFTFEDFRLNDRHLARVNVANGNLLVEADDIAIAGTGLSNSLMRSYNSLDTSSGEFGKGWSFSTGTGLRLDEQSNGDVWLLGPSGYRVLFKKDGGDYEDPVGIDAKLTNEPAPDGWELELSQSEERYEFSDQGRLDKHVDKNDHAITFTRSGGEL